MGGGGGREEYEEKGGEGGRERLGMRGKEKQEEKKEVEEKRSKVYACMHLDLNMYETIIILMPYVDDKLLILK